MLCYVDPNPQIHRDSIILGKMQMQQRHMDAKHSCRGAIKRHRYVYITH
jgi:hypothetical protein